MKIDVTKLKENRPENFQELLNPVELDLNTSEIKYKAKARLSSEVRKEGSVLHTNSHFSADVEYACSRCLKEYAQNIEKDFDIKYPLEGSTQFIDLTEDIRDEVILNYPVRFLCKPDCRGLCPKCGQDLNENMCRCQMRP